MQDQYGSCIIDYSQYKKRLKNNYKNNATVFPSTASCSPLKQSIRSDSRNQTTNLDISPTKSRLSASPSRTSNIFLENRKLTEQLHEKQTLLNTYKLVVESIIDAIGKVFSKEAAEQIRQMVVMLSSTFQQNTQNTEQQQRDSSELSESSSMSSFHQNTVVYKSKDLGSSLGNIGHTIEEIMRSSNCKNKVIETERGMHRNFKKQALGPSAFILNNELSSPEKNKKSPIRSNYQSNISSESQLKIFKKQKYEVKYELERNKADSKKQSGSEPVTGHKIHPEQQNYYQKQSLESFQSHQEFSQIITISDSSPCQTQNSQMSQQFIALFSQLSSLKQEIEEQMVLLQSSKQKIDRDKERKRLQKDLQKIQRVIQLKRKQMLLASNRSIQGLHMDCVQEQREQMTKNKKMKKVGEKRPHK